MIPNLGKGLSLAGLLGMSGCSALYSGAAPFQKDPARATSFANIGGALGPLEAALISNKKEDPKCREDVVVINRPAPSQPQVRSEAIQNYLEDKYLPKIKELDEIEKTRDLTSIERRYRTLLMHRIDSSVPFEEIPEGSEIARRYVSILNELRNIEKNRLLTSEEQVRRDYVQLSLNK